MYKLSICIAIFATQLLWSMDDAGVRKTLKDLESPDAKVRADAVQELAPLFADLAIAWAKAQRDGDPLVISAFQKAEILRTKRLLADPTIAGLQITRNETMAAKQLIAAAEAQEIYRRTDYDRDNVLEYAQAATGDNSLQETKAGKRDIDLLGSLPAAAFGDPKSAKPFAGYFFKILKKMESKKSGVVDFIQNGNMVLGYAIVAYPAEYDKTGKNTFMVNNAMAVFQADLGPKTHEIVEKMDTFNPDSQSGWKSVE